MTFAVIKLHPETKRCVFASASMALDDAKKLYENLGGEEKGYELTSGEAALALKQGINRPVR